MKFPRASWQMPGVKEKGVHPIIPVKSRSALDRHGLCSRLTIVRRQLPLAQAFAMIAHVSQGQTLEAAVFDVCISSESSQITSYVALSRVRDRKDLLILRPLQRSGFTSPPMMGPDLLLKHWHGEHVDWKQLETDVRLRRKRPRESDVVNDHKRKQKLISTLGQHENAVLSIFRHKGFPEVFFSVKETTSCRHLCDGFLKVDMICRKCGHSREVAQFSATKLRKTRAQQGIISVCSSYWPEVHVAVHDLRRNVPRRCKACVNQDRLLQCSICGESEPTVSLVNMSLLRRKRVMHCDSCKPRMFKHKSSCPGCRGVFLPS